MVSSGSIQILLWPEPRRLAASRRWLFRLTSLLPPRCRNRSVSYLDFRGPAGFFLSDLACDAAGSPPCWLYTLVAPAFLLVERGLAIVRHFYFTFTGPAGVSRLVFVSM